MTRPASILVARVIGVVFGVVIGVVGVGSVAGCSFDLSVPAGVKVRCASNDECPDGLACARTGLCVDAERLNEDAIAFDGEPQLSRTLFSCAADHDTGRIDFALTKPPQSVIVRVDDVVLDVTDADGGAGADIGPAAVFGACAGGDDRAVEGVHNVVVEAADDLGNVARASFAITYDFTAPSVIVDDGFVAYFPGAENPRAASVALDGAVLDTATDGTLASITFVLDEPASVTDLFVGPLSIVGGDLSAEPTLSVNVFREVSADYPEGALAITADAEDAAGNAAIVDTGLVLVVDRTAPAPLDVEKLRLVRRPWGDEEFAGARVEVVGDAGAAVEPLALLNVTLENGALLQQLAADDGAFALGAPGDSRSAAVVVVDAAGNASAAVDVVHVTWMATLNGKVPGSVFENPNVLTEVPRFGAAQETPFDREARDPAALARGDGAALTTTTALSIREKSFTTTIAGQRVRRNAVFARDEKTGRLVYGAGNFQIGSFDDRVFAVNEDQIIEVEGTSNLPPRGDSVSAYDKRRGVFVLFGGRANGALSDETWESDDGLRWRERVVTPPPARELSDAVYDEDRGVVVVFGGNGEGNVDLGDTWAFDGTDWTPIDSALSPPARSSVSMGFLPGVGVVLFGGEIGDAPVADTWVLDDAGWREVTTSTLTPAARLGASLAFDPSSDQLLMFGGRPTDDDAVGLNDTFRFDGAQWTVAGTFFRPDPRFHAAIATDVAGGRVLLQGGEEHTPNIGTGFNGFTDVWQWKNGWIPLSLFVNNGAAALESQGVAFDPARNEVVLFSGGIVASAVGVSNQTFTFNGNSFTDEDPAFSMSPTFNSSLAAFRGGVIAVGVNDTQTFRWSGTNWAVVAGNPPDNVDRVKLVTDLANDRVVGVGNGKTFTYDGSTWTLQCTFGGRERCPRAEAAVAYDVVRGRVVAYDGVDVMTWNGSAWADDNATVLPTPPTPGALVFDVARATLLMLRTSVAGHVDVHSYADGVFSPVALVEEPIARSNAAIVYDGARDNTVIVGGHSAENNASTSDVLVVEADAAPAHVFRAAFASAGARGAVLDDVTLDVVGAAAGGFDVFCWRNGRWETVAAVEVAGGVSGVIDDDRLPLLPFGREQQLVFAWAPKTVALGAAVSTDAARVTVRYRR